MNPVLIGCGGSCGPVVGCVVGAEKLTTASGVWVKARFYREGHFLCATVFSVASGEPKIVELRVDLRPIARAVMRAHATLHAKDLAKASVRGGTTVGWGLGSLWKGAKKAAKAIGRNKLVKGVVGVTKTIAKGAKNVIKSKVTGLVAAGLAAFPLTAPIGVAALGAYAAANAAIAGAETGAKVVKTARSAASTIAQGARLAKRVTGAKASTNTAIQAASARLTPAQRATVAKRTLAAGRVSLNAKGKAAVTNTLAKAPPAKKAAVAKSIATKLKTAVQLRQRATLAKNLPGAAGKAVLASTRLEVQAGPAIKKAAATAKKLQDPKVRAKLVALRAQGTKAETLLKNVATAAKSGSLDAQKSAVIVNLVARNRARIQAMSQANAGGLPGVLITQDGKLKRGKFRVQAVAAAGGLLYQGRGKPKERGTFQTVSGLDLFGEPVQLESGENVRLSSVAVNGDLPLDGVRMTTRGAASDDIGPYEIGSYELIGCGSTPCAPCAARAS